PQVVSARANAWAAAAGVRAARTQYLPSLSVQVGWSGSARESGSERYVIEQAKGQLASQKASCELLNNISAGLTKPLPGTPADCSPYEWTAEKERAVLASNNVFPFNYTAQPMYAQVTLSLPLFSGFSRERELESARVAEQDAQEQVRAQELALRTGVQAGVAAVETARRSVELEAKNRELASEQLAMERERYRVGASSFLQLQEAETIKARADRDYLAALYGYHEAMAALEATVGSPLR
ncbi:MAG: TolC family protein, partial [Gemmatimonadetes bacterium]|nr:TolC family protein [Gemmatimonadota bacterium]